MKEERWHKIEKIFNHALLLPAGERNSFIKKQCHGDDALYGEVISLLDTDNAPNQILEQSLFPFVARLLENDFSQLLEKTDFGSYKLQILLGRGGMGVVFLAQDMRLERPVALKVIPPEIAENYEILLRFKQEAKAASAISHQNVAHIYEFDVYQGKYFLSMEYISGKTLRELLEAKQIDLRCSVEIALQVASALNAAHALSITHRDIKPENIMLTNNGLVKVLDFGLAKFGEKNQEKERSRLNTHPGLIMGTTAYMSPEQIRGQAVDERSDLWSLGVVLYEMIAGERPFRGNTVSDRQAAILLKEQPILPFRNDIPFLDRVIQKALVKDVSLRYQSAKEFIHDLRKLRREVYNYLQLTDEQKLTESSCVSPQIQVNNHHLLANEVSPISNRGSIQPAAANQQTGSNHGSASGTKPTNRRINRQKFNLGLILMVVAIGAGAVIYFSYFSHFLSRSAVSSASSIAVLPFVNTSNDPNTEYLSDGISESLIDNLSQLPGVKVIARNSSFKFKGKEIEPQEVARTLGVEAIVTGRIVLLGDHFIISVEMINATDKTQMWGAQYNRQASDLFQMQSEISREIAEKMRVRLIGSEEWQLNRGEVNPEAYQLDLKALYYWNKGGSENRKKSIEFYKQAISIDPVYASAYANLSIAYTLLVSNGILNPKEFNPKAEQAARQALELDDHLAEAHLALGWIKLNDWDWAEADKEYKQALKLNPNLSRAHDGYAYYFSFTGHPDEAITENRRAIELDPIALVTTTNAGNIRYLARQYDEALAELKKPLELDPAFATAYVYEGYVYAAKGMYQEAIAAYQKAIQLGGETTSRLIFLGAAYAKSKNRGKAEEILWQLRISKEYTSPGELAILYAALDDRERAFTALEQAFSEHDLQLQYLGVDPAYDSLREDLRFRNLLRRLNLPQ